MQTGVAGINLIKDFESLVLSAYICPAGMLTIGYGHTAKVTPGMRITAQQAEDLLRSDLRTFEAEVNGAVRVPLTQNQFDALVCFCFNVGSGNFASSTLLRLLNQGNYVGAADQFLLWNRSNGQVLAGLTRRRQAERTLFLRADESSVVTGVAAP